RSRRRAHRRGARRYLPGSTGEGHGGSGRLRRRSRSFDGRWNGPWNGPWNGRGNEHGNSRRDGTARTRLQQPRHVPRLRRARRCLRRGGARAHGRRRPMALIRAPEAEEMPDVIMLVVAAALLAIGLLMVTSASVTL